MGGRVYVHVTPIAPPHQSIHCYTAPPSPTALSPNPNTTILHILTPSNSGSTADCFTLMERLERKLEEHPGQLTRACVDLAKAWRTDKYLRRLEVSAWGYV